LPVGFAVLVLALLTGEQIKTCLHVPIPGNVLGLFVLLPGFYLRLISPQLVEDAAKRLLFVLPALSIPLFVSAIGRGQLWSHNGWAFLAVILLATAGLWAFVGHSAQHLLRKSIQDE
jgi:holin-like protein